MKIDLKVECEYCHLARTGTLENGMPSSIGSGYCVRCGRDTPILITVTVQQ